MHYELAPWLPALCSWVPAPAGYCDASRAVNMLELVGFSLLIPWRSCPDPLPAMVQWLACSESLLVASYTRDSSLLTPDLLLPLTLNWLPLAHSLQGWQGINASFPPSQSTPRCTELQGLQRISGVYLLSDLCDAGLQRPPEPEPEGGGLPAAPQHCSSPPTVPGHSVSIHLTLPVCNLALCLADFSCKSLGNRDE